MATYYVRTDGSNSNTGTGPNAGQAWQTIAKAITSAVAPGDTIYIAPGIYREPGLAPTFTNPSSNAQRISYIGDTSATQFVGVSLGPVIITTYTTNTSGQTTYLLNWNKDYTTFENICFIGYPTRSAPVYGSLIFMTCIYPIFTKCLIQQTSTSTQNHGIHFMATYNVRGPEIRKCVFLNTNIIIQGTGTAAGQWDSQTRIEDCIFQVNNSFTNMEGVRIYSDPQFTLGGITVNNNYISGYAGVGVINQGSSTYPAIVQNNYIEASNVALTAGATNQMTQTYNVLFGSITRTNVSSSVTSYENVFAFKNGDISRIQGWANYPFVAPITSQGLQINTGINTLSPATDIYGVTWNTPTTPTIGAAEFNNYAPASAYIPTERNAGVITIAPDSTSQSIELYLGVTSLTSSSSGLSARYNRTRTASVNIPLVARTIDEGAPASAGVWISGGFAEVDSTNMPGVYRLDIPNAALAAGADDVTVVVRGASGTNGAVMTIKLSSGGLTAAQTAQAVLDATASTHNNIGSIGASIQDKAGYSLSTPQSFSTTGSVGSVTGNVAGNVTGTVGGVAGNVTGNIAGSVATVASPDNIIDGVWDEQRVGHTASGSFGEKLQTNALADEMLARDLGSGLNLGNAEERTVRSALRAIRNKVNVGSSQMVVKREDDTTDAWTASVTTTAVSSNVSGIDPN